MLPVRGSVWFTQLSSFALTQQHRGRVLQLAYKVLLHIQKLAQQNTDEVTAGYVIVTTFSLTK